MSSAGKQNDPENASESAVTKAIRRELHQMAQPLTVLQGALDLALTQSEGSDVATHHTLELARREIFRISSGLEHVRRLVRLQQTPSDLTRVSVSRVLCSALERMERQFNAAGIQVAVNQPRDIEEGVLASESRMREAFTLLLSSGLKFLPQGGRITVDLSVAGDGVSVRIQFVGAGQSRGALSDVSHNLELAAAMLRSTGAEVSLGEVPFSVLVRLLPAAAHATGA